MKTLVAVRIPDELVKLLDAKGSRSEVIVDALRAYLAAPEEKHKVVLPDLKQSRHSQCSNCGALIGHQKWCKR